jgi:hypothetical protein
MILILKIGNNIAYTSILDDSQDLTAERMESCRKERSQKKKSTVATFPPHPGQMGIDMEITRLQLLPKA